MDKRLQVSAQKFVGKTRPGEGVWAGCLELTPEDQRVREVRGRLYAVLGLRGNPRLELGRLGERGRAVLKDHYYQSRTSSPLEALEGAVAAVREDVFKAAFDSKRPGAEEVLEVNLAAASLWGSVLYVAKLGSAAVYLSRGDVFRELGQGSVQKIFIASGMIHEGDRLLLGSHSFAADEVSDDFQSPEGLAILALRFHFERTPAEEEALQIMPLRRKRSFLDRWARRKVFKLLLGGALVLTFLLASVFTVRKRQQNFRAEEVARLTASAEQYVAEARDFVDLNNTKARELLRAAKKDLEEAQRIDPQYVEAAPKIKEINVLLDEVGNVVRLSELELFYDLKIGNEKLVPVALAGRPPALYVAAYMGDGGSAAVYVLQIDDPPILNKALDKELRQVSHLDFSGERLFIISLEGVSVFDTRGESFVVEDAELGLPADQIADLAVYFGNLYLLAPSKNQIFKLSSLEGGFSLPQSWIEDSADLTSSVSLAIDGSIYVLTSAGEIKKFEKGAWVSDFEVRGLDKPIKDPAKIFTTVDSENLYVLDSGGRRVVVIKKTGYYAQQYVYEGDRAFKDVKDFFVDEEAGLIYLLDGTKIFTIPLVQ